VSEKKDSTKAPEKPAEKESGSQSKKQETKKQIKLPSSIKLPKVNKQTGKQTRARRIFRGPLFWIIAALILVSVFGQISASGQQFEKVSTSKIIELISTDKVKSAVIVDRDQKIRVVLKSGEFVKGSAKLKLHM